AGARAGIKAGSSASFWDFIKILKNLEKRRPPLVLLENVPGFLTSNGGMDFREAMVSLNELGYTLDSFIIDAVSFVPHSRKRLFVIGILDRIKNHLNKKRALVECVESSIRPKSLVEFIKSNKDIRWNIRQLPAPPQRTQDLQDIL